MMESLIPSLASGGINANVWVIALAGAISFGVPLTLAALGEILAERSGVLNLGVEGMMLVGAVTAFLVTRHIVLGCRSWEPLLLVEPWLQSMHSSAYRFERIK